MMNNEVVVENYKGKPRTTITIREYEVREIDAYGDTIDINHYDSRREAMGAFHNWKATTEPVAIVVEQHTSRFPAFLFARPDRYKLIATSGDYLALELGGWKE